MAQGPGRKVPAGSGAALPDCRGLVAYREILCASRVARARRAGATRRSGSICLNKFPRFTGGIRVGRQRCRVVHGGAVLVIGPNSSSQNFNGHPVTTITARISVAPGNSGGPLLDRLGRVVGVVSSRAETVGGVSIGLAIAIATTEFGRVIQTFNPREADSLGFIGEIPGGGRSTDSIPGRAQIAPRGDAPSTRPPTDFELAELQAQNHECAQRLLLPSNAGERTFHLSVPGAPQLLHFPAQFNRILLATIPWPQQLRLTFSASRDGGKTFVCILR